jgi:serine/threonine protein kinase/formylglycine-generating enzyme required for sulfatase activity
LAKPRADDWSPPDEFDEYKLVRQLGRGTMGQVFLAHDRLLDRLVAVKFITALEASARERFVVEARAAARIQHPNVVAVHRVGELRHRPYLITEYVRGQSLAEIKLPVSWQRALELGIGLARGLAAAHRQGVLHRDIKLANAMLSEHGEVKLLDFSLAKLVDVPPLDKLRTVAPAQPRVDRSPLGPIHDAPTSPQSLLTKATGSEEHVQKSRMDDTVTMPAPGPAGAEAEAEAPATRDAPVDPDSWRDKNAEITAVGALVGTPHYMAPELWRGEAASRSSDVYAMGVLLYCLCCGQPPTEAATMLELAERVQESEPRPLLERAPDTDAKLAAVIERCIHRDPKQRYASGDELREALETLQPGHRGSPVPGGNPYRGLQVFDAAHRELFFGRSSEVTAVITRLRSQNFVLVAGDSGVGKSSLCRAGVLPAICDGALDASVPWTAATLTPGRRPVQALMSALAKTREIDESLLMSGITDPEILARGIGGANAQAGTILFIDQLEELITLAPPAEAQIAAKLIGAIAAGIPRVRLLATVRGDFLTRIAPLPGFGEQMVKGLFFLYPLSAANVRKAIVGPANARNVRFESEALVNKLVTAGVEGSLPLLQFALAELWEARSPNSNVITAAALEKIGGVSGALARHAEGVLARLSSPQRRAARSLLLRLVTIDETRASLSRDELAVEGDDAWIALESLLAARLILVRDVAEGPPVYEIAHEALIRGWVSLQVWLDEEKENRLVRHRLEHGAAEWDRLDHPRDALWSIRQVEEGRRLDPATLRPRELAFLQASADRAQRGRRRKYAVMIGVPVLVVLSFVASYLVQLNRVQREIDARMATTAEMLAEARAGDERVEGHRVTAFAAFDAGDEATGESHWKQAIREAPAVQFGYARAAGQLELALGLDPGRADVRRALADVLFEQALLSERDRDDERAEALILRVEVHDPQGERLARWRAPARVSVTSEPPGAEVTVARYERDADGKQQLGEAQLLGAAPLGPVLLPPGSYLWTLSAEGRASVNYPVLLRRGEEFAATIDLPRPQDVPPGFVYVPPGRFLVGSADDEALRRGFLTAAPLHEARTGGYYIARTETTYGYWLAFLDALPAAEQLRRGGRDGSALTRDADGVWRLETRRGERPVTARAGELLRFVRGDREVEHDWLRLPVTGISADDVRAYVDWLDRTRKVPGARICSELEWERAARGADGRPFPTGDDISPNEANFDATYGRDPAAMSPDPVGSFPASASPFGLLDVCGNVWEWVRPIGPVAYMLARGGSYLQGQSAGRVANRTILDQSYLERTLGLRVCATPSVRGVSDK